MLFSVSCLLLLTIKFSNKIQYTPKLLISQILDYVVNIFPGIEKVRAEEPQLGGAHRDGLPYEQSA